MFIYSFDLLKHPLMSKIISLFLSTYVRKSSQLNSVLTVTLVVESVTPLLAEIIIQVPEIMIEQNNSLEICVTKTEVIISLEIHLA